jgi:hypothetical protein
MATKTHIPKNLLPMLNRFRAYVQTEANRLDIDFSIYYDNENVAFEFLPYDASDEVEPNFVERILPHNDNIS